MIGAHYPRLVAKNRRAISAADARGIAERRIGASGRLRTDGSVVAQGFVVDAAVPCG